MLRVSFLVFLFSAITAYGQTKAIAFKSHSGNPAYFTYDGDGYFGLMEPMPHLDSIVKVNDSTVISYTNTSEGPYAYDTLVDHPFWCKPELIIDSIIVANYPQVKFVGFETEAKKKNVIQLAKPTRSVKNSNHKKALDITGQQRVLLQRGTPLRKFLSAFN